MKQGKFNIIISAQSDSIAIGNLSSHLISTFDIKHLAISSSPDCGFHIPPGAVISAQPWIYLGPSSIISPKPFLQEISDMGVDHAKILIHPRASIMTFADTIHTTRADKLIHMSDVIFADSILKLRHRIDDTVFMLNDLLCRDVTVLCEITHGFDLDLEHGTDPYCHTSKMINPAMAMAEAGVSPKWLGDVYGVVSGNYSQEHFERFCQVCCPDLLCLRLDSKITSEIRGSTYTYIQHWEQENCAKVAYVIGKDNNILTMGVDR